MKVLFFVDTHGSISDMHRLKDKAKDAELLVCAGDFSVFENDMARILREFNDIGKPILLIHGNHETSAGVMMECEQLKNLHFIHKNYYIAGDKIFYGFGGGGFSIRDESFTHEAELFIAELHRLSENSGIKYRLVLITHAPPYGTKLDYIGSHVGNKSISEFIIKYSPMLAVSGHLHENEGVEDNLGTTMLFNPGPEGRIIDL